MFKTINLAEELLSLKKKKNFSKEEELVINEAEKIMKTAQAEDIKILSSMGIDHSLKEAEDIHSLKTFSKDLDQNRIFSKSEIKDLCVKYGLRFLSIEKFKGEVDAEIPSKVKEFQKLYTELKYASLERTKYDFSYDKFMVCAPKESFQLSERPVDPLLFYPLDGRNGDRFFLIHKWGNDISSWNAVKNWKKRSIWHWALYVYLIWYVPFFSIVLSITNCFNIWLMLGCSLVGLLISRSILSDDFGKYLSDKNWDSEYRN